MKYIFADMKKIALILTLLIGTTAFGNETPGFEFCINGKIYTSQDPVWSFSGSSDKMLSNGGIRTTYHIKGIKALRGLEIFWDKEVSSVLPTSTERTISYFRNIHSNLLPLLPLLKSA